MREAVLKAGVVEQRPKGIAQQQVAIALGKGGFGHLDRFFRYYIEQRRIERQLLPPAIFAASPI